MLKNYDQKSSNSGRFAKNEAHLCQRFDELRVSETESTFLRRALTLYVWV